MAEKAEGLITREEKIAQAKELYSRGSRNYLVKSYEEAADDLSQVCSLYSELYGELSNELGMPYLLYAKSLIALALEENRIVDVPEEDNDDDDGDDEAEDDDDENEEPQKGTDDAKEPNGKETNDKKVEGEETNDKKVEKEETNDKKVEEEKETNDKEVVDEKNVENDVKPEEKEANKEDDKQEKENKQNLETNGEKSVESASKTEEMEPKIEEGTSKPEKKEPVANGSRNFEPKPGTSNGIVEEDDTVQDNDDEIDEATTNLQVAWETLELAARIFENQGESALPNLAEVYTELANIEFENNIMQSARDDYNKALDIYKQLSSNYRRPMAEITYKIGLSHLMEQASSESAEFLKEACKILDEEINEMKIKENPTEKDKLNLQDMEETKQEIWAKITEIEESLQECISEVRAVIKNHMNPQVESEFGESSSATSAAGAGSGSSSTDKPKPTDISHLVKRKKPDTPTVDNEMSPAKRPAT